MFLYIKFQKVDLTVFIMRWCTHCWCDCYPSEIINEVFSRFKEIAGHC